MRTYTIFWRGGKAQIITGNTPFEAMNNAGIKDTIKAVAFGVEGDKRREYVWNKRTKKWEKL